jgi:hypothetical protein
MRLAIGEITLAGALAARPAMVLADERGSERRFSMSDLLQPRMGTLSPHLHKVTELVVGYTDLPNLDFLVWLPNITHVRILTPSVKNISGLRYLEKLESLAINRPTCRMDVLGELESLKILYLDDWRPGASSIFRLRGLVKVGLQKIACPNLLAMSGWSLLEELWLNAGRLEDLTGIPRNIRRLRLTSLRKLSSLQPLLVCSQLEDLRLESCRGVNTLHGLEPCYRLKTLSIVRGDVLQCLEPLRDLRDLEYLVIADGTCVEGNRVDVLYALPGLKTLIISKRSGVEIDKLLRTAPHCDVRLTAR